MTPGSASLSRAPHRSSIRWALMAFACLGPALSHAQAPVTPPSPGQSIPMEMDDTQTTGMLLLDQLEWRDTSSGATAAWEGEGWYGGDYDKLGVRTEGEEGEGGEGGGATDDARIEAFWDRIVTRWWSVQVGAREDVSGGPSRTWVGVGLEGLAPEWLHVEATLYAGESGRTAARLWSTYDLLITQRLILQPELEANLYGKADPARHLGSGLSDLEAGLRLRYEFRREIAPYVGVVWQRLCGDTADLARMSAERPGGAEFTAGIRVWL